MSKEFLDVVPSLSLAGCGDHVIHDAITTNRKVVKIIWDEDDVPEHAKGYIQWSTRPYRVTDRCDGTRDSNAMLVCHELSKATGLDINSIYHDAYSDENRETFFTPEYLKHLEQHRCETEIPELTAENIIHLLKSLYDMNWRSFTEKLSEAWADKGYAVDDFYHM